MNSQKILLLIQKKTSKYFEALDFINRNKCDIISPSENAEKIKAV